MINQVLKLFPRSRLGKLSIILIVISPILFFIGSSFKYKVYKLIPAGDTILEDIFKRPALALTMLLGMGSGILAFIVGALAIILRKDHSLLVYLSTIIGALLTIFLICEVICE